VRLALRGLISAWLVTAQQIVTWALDNSSMGRRLVQHKENLAWNLNVVERLQFCSSLLPVIAELNLAVDEEFDTSWPIIFLNDGNDN
jgi:hypothetical protein